MACSSGAATRSSHLPLSSLTGQSAALAQLLAAARRPSHAYLLVGSDAQAKRAAAIAFAQALLCAAPRPDGDACGACTTCQAIAGSGHPDLRVWDLPEGEKTFKVEQVRELIAAVQRKPFSAPRQVQVLAALDQMNLTGWNALLKTIEEPPPSTVMVLLSRDPEALLPTIVSRCQLVRFGPGAAATTAAPPPLPGPGGAMAWADGLAAKNQDDQAAALDALLGWCRDQAIADPQGALAWVGRAEAIEAARAALGRHANARLVWDRLARKLG